MGVSRRLRRETGDEERKEEWKEDKENGAEYRRGRGSEGGRRVDLYEATFCC